MVSNHDRIFFNNKCASDKPGFVNLPVTSTSTSTDEVSVMMQISDTVYPMYKAFIEPDLETAHLKIHNTFNPFSGFMNATYILKSQKTITVEEAESVLQV